MRHEKLCAGMFTKKKHVCLCMAFRVKIRTLPHKQAHSFKSNIVLNNTKKSITMSRDHSDIKDKKEKTDWVDGSSMIMVKGKGNKRKEDEASLRTNDFFAWKFFSSALSKSSLKNLTSSSHKSMFFVDQESHMLTFVSGNIVSWMQFYDCDCFHHSRVSCSSSSTYIKFVHHTMKFVVPSGTSD